MSTAEWKEGYRDGLNAAVAVAQTVASEKEATADEVLTLLEILADSPILDTKPEDHFT